MKLFASVNLWIFLMSFLFITPASFAGNDWFPQLTPDIPDVFTEIDPEEVYPDFEYNGLEPACASCPPTMNNDGTLTFYDPKFTFFVRGGTVNKLVIYFQGGGACWDSMNCLYAHTYYEAVPPIESFADTEGMGILDTENPLNPFKDWFVVYIPYCTGDIHWGAADTEYQDYAGAYGGFSQTIKHRGFVNFQVVLKWVEDNFIGPRKIFVTGSSAGSYGAILGFPYIKEAFPWSIVSVLGDAGNGVNGEEFQTNSTQNWKIQVPEWIPGFEEGYQDWMTIDFVYTSIADYYPWSKFAQFTTAWDWNQTFFYNVMLNINDPGGWFTTWPDVWPEWNETMLEYTHSTAENLSNYRYFIAPGCYHMIMTSPTFYEEETAGIPFRKWVNAMVNNPFGTQCHLLEGNWKNLECGADCIAPPAPDDCIVPLADYNP